MKKVFKVGCIVMISILTIILCTSISKTEKKVSANLKVNEKCETKKADIHNKKDIEEFIDNYFNKNMDKYHDVGASISIVDNNETILRKSYGYSNLEEKAEIDSEKTTFALCSGSKLFTAAGIMKLYEEGKIDLDKDINEYIYPYKIKNSYKKNVTCRNLLTHSSGVDESSELNSKTEYVDKILSQEEYMNMHTPQVVCAPDTICRYSNEGYNLLGYIIEKVSNMSYEKYIEENILKPLNMNNTSIRVYDNNLAQGYIYDEEEYSKFPLLYQYTSGSSGIITTSFDMENFMDAILNKGIFNDTRILKEETIDMMESKQFSNDDIFEGMGLGFERSKRYGIDIIKHEGALPGYTSTTFLLPKEKFGICILTNTLGALPFNFENEFMNYFYNEKSEDVQNLTNNDLRIYEGYYRSYDGVSKSNIMKIFGIFEDMHVIDNKDGTLTLEECTTEKENIKTKLIPIGENLFKRDDNRGDFAFRLDEKGNAIYAFNDVSFNSFEKVSFFERCGIIETLIVLIFIMIIIDSINIIVNRKKQNKLNIINLISKIMFVIGLVGIIILVNFMSYNNDFCSMFWIYLFLTIINLSVLLIVISICLTLYITVKKKINCKKLYFCYSINFLLNTALIIFMYYFNLLGYKVS